MSKIEAVCIQCNRTYNKEETKAAITKWNIDLGFKFRKRHCCDCDVCGTPMLHPVEVTDYYELKDALRGKFLF